MPTDRERETWREIRRWLIGDSELEPTFPAVELHGPGDHVRLRRQHTVLVVFALVIQLFVGPNLLTDAEIAGRRRPPKPLKALRRP